MATKEHTKVKPGFNLPTVPNGFDQVCAFAYQDGDWEIDFINHERCDFASETMDVNIEWPWVDGFERREAGWQAIGVCAIYE